MIPGGPIFGVPRNGSKSGPAILPTKHCREMLRRMFLPLKCATRPIERKPPRKELRRTCLWRTVSDWISGAENCTVTRRSPAHWPVMSEGNRHVFNHLLYQILAWNFSSSVIRWHGFIFGLVCQGFEVLGRLEAAILRLCREFLISSWRQNNPAISELLFWFAARATAWPRVLNFWELATVIKELNRFWNVWSLELQLAPELSKCFEVLRFWFGAAVTVT